MRTFFARVTIAGLVAGSCVALAACGSREPPGKYPAREPGCEVQVFPENPSYQTENIGPVQASCEETVSDDDCLRTLKDQACKLGADTIWGVNDTPTKELGRKKYSGRAAHQK